MRVTGQAGLPMLVDCTRTIHQAGAGPQKTFLFEGAQRNPAGISTTHLSLCDLSNPVSGWCLHGAGGSGPTLIDRVIALWPRPTPPGVGGRSLPTELEQPQRSTSVTGATEFAPPPGVAVVADWFGWP